MMMIRGFLMMIRGFLMMIRGFLRKTGFQHLREATKIWVGAPYLVRYRLSRTLYKKCHTVISKTNLIR